MVTQSPTLKLNNGQIMPQLGLGTWKSEPEKVIEAVETAINEGYRLIDCAYIYENENEVGQGIQKALKNNICKREDLFIVSKLWNTAHRPSKVMEALQETLDNLNVEYLDLYLMHWPIAMVPNEGLWPKDGDDVKLDPEVKDFMDTWKEMEKLVKTTKVKSIGLCNVNQKQLQRVLKEGSVKPTVIQNEVHPMCYDESLMRFCKSENVTVMCYAPLGHGSKTNLLENSIVTEIAEKNDLTPAQVLLLWSLTEGRIVIPKSSNPKRVKENFQFLSKMQHLDQEDMQQLGKVSHGKQIRTCDPKDFFGVPIFG